MQGIPPGYEVKLELWRNKDEVCVDGYTFKKAGESDVEPDARIVVEKALLHVPIGL